MGRYKKALTALIVIIVVFAAAVVGMSYWINRTMIDRGVEYTVTSQTSEKIRIDAEEKARIKELDPECAIVLGAGLNDPETPSMMLKDRLDLAVYMYRHKLVPKLLLTGDNGQVHHNEIHVMLNYCLDAGVPSEDIFCDHAGFSTYESMYRADYIFRVERAVVITQYYHLFRALWLADGFGIEALGAASDQQQPYPHQKYRNDRENLARVKDYFMLTVKPKPKYLGDTFPITGDSGEETHGE
ncbi:MAG: YdcF family protein [Eubacterium sp.]|nr:YdcF family protein [Eubacterium sp.]